MRSDGAHLLLLALDGDPLAAVPGLEEEDARPGLADRPRREGVDVFELEEDAHDGASSFNEPPVELTAKTMGPSVV